MTQESSNLNNLEKYILAHETPDFSFLSHLILETRIPLHPTQIHLAVSRMFNEIPHLRSQIQGENRVISEKPWFSPESRVKDLGTIQRKELPCRLEQKFDLSKEPPLRLAYGRFAGGNFFLVMTVHHASIDGIGQGHLLNEFLLGYLDQPFSSWALRYESFSFKREIFGKFSPWAWNTLVLSSLKRLAAVRGRKRSSLTLVGNPKEKRRQIRFLHFPIDEKEVEIKKRSALLGFEKPFDFLFFCIMRAADRTAPPQERPVSVITPLNLRPTFKIRNSFHNIDGLCRVSFPRSVISGPGFPSALSREIKKELTPVKALSLILLLGLLEKTLGPRKFANWVHRQEYGSEQSFSTAFVSAGKVPRFSINPEALEIERVYGYGSLTRSPGLGILLTGLKNKQTLVIEYLEGVISEDTVHRFSSSLLKELLGEDFPIESL